MFLKDARQLATDVRLIGFAILSEAHEIKRGKKFHLHSLLLQVGRQHVRADDFALRKNLLAHLLCIFLRTHGVQEREAVVEEVKETVEQAAEQAEGAAEAPASGN